MPRPSLELADIFRQHGEAYRATHELTLAQQRVMRAVTICRTATLGGHVAICDRCGAVQISYNSCRNRHCPKCQFGARQQWLDKRQDELLPVEYFHVVFTLPEAVAAIAFYNQEEVYSLLFRSVAATLRTIAGDPRHLGAEIGFFAVLHTWGQNLMHHPHLHCVVPGGGLAPDGKSWVACRPGFFLPVRVLSRLFRRLFLQGLQALFASGQLNFFGELRGLREAAAFTAYLQPVQEQEWVVYAKPPFGGPQQVLAYLGRYTHRVAISNQRLLALTDGQVTFQWKDYRRAGREKSRVMTLPADEFIRRFLLHTLPRGFPRIRHFGWAANAHRRRKLALCRQLLTHPVTELLPAAADCKALAQALDSRPPRRCPDCGQGYLIAAGSLEAYLWPARPPDT